MTNYIAKPNILNSLHKKEFSEIRTAVKYLNSFLTDDMPVLYAEDAYLIGKLYAADGSTTWIEPKEKRKPGRPRKVVTV